MTAETAERPRVGPCHAACIQHAGAEEKRPYVQTDEAKRREAEHREENLLARLRPGRALVRRARELAKDRPLQRADIEKAALQMLKTMEPGDVTRIAGMARWPLYEIGSDHPAAPGVLHPAVQVAAIGRTTVDGRRVFVGQVAQESVQIRVESVVFPALQAGDIVASVMPWSIRDREGLGSRWGIGILYSPSRELNAARPAHRSAA